VVGCENGDKPGFVKKAGYFLTIRVTVSFPNNILKHTVFELIIVVFIIIRFSAASV
jgi:hypothetical protein